MIAVAMIAAVVFQVAAVVFVAVVIVIAMMAVAVSAAALQMLALFQAVHMILHMEEGDRELVKWPVCYDMIGGTTFQL